MERISVKNYILLTLIAALVSGFLTVPLSLYLSSHFESKKSVREAKLAVLRDTVGYRYIFNQPNKPGYDKFVSSYNQIFIVFNDSSKVIETLNKFQIIRQNPSFPLSVNNEAFIELIKAMMDDLEIERKNLDDKFFGKIMTVGE
ncbi:MAG: DUF6680 family protein [Planctomycetota bacterium]